MKRAISQEFSFWQLLAFSVPAVAMLVVSSLYTAVDGVFVSRFVGSDGLSAINIVLPLDTLAFGGRHHVRHQRHCGAQAGPGRGEGRRS